MKQLILIVCLLLCFLSASATHYRGSFITFKRDTTQNPDPRRLFFTLTVFTDAESQAQDPEFEVTMGDGQKIVVPRLSVTPVGHLSSRIDRETYKWEYTYGSDGSYTVSVVIINRNPNILTMPQPSDQSPVYVQTAVKINAAGGFNSSPQFLSPKPVGANIGYAVNYNLLAYDPDGDSIAYKLITPKTINTSGSAIPVPGYTFPDQLFNCKNADYTDAAKFEISERDGQLVWNSPCRKGEYNYAVAVEEWRNGVKMSEITYDMQILVFDEPYVSLDIVKNDAQKYSPEGYLIVRASDKVAFEVLYSYIKPDEYGTGNYFTSELSQVLKVPVTYSIAALTSGGYPTFSFNPDQSLIRNLPYFINFHGRSSYFAYTRSIGIIIRSDQPTINLKWPDHLQKSSSGFFVTSVNKATKFSMFAENWEGYVQTLSVESPLATSATQFAFTVRDTTDGKVGELMFQPSEQQQSSQPQPIIFRAIYNPARVAGQRAAFAGEPIIKEVQVQLIVEQQQQPTATPDELATAAYLLYPNQVQNKFTVQSATPALLQIYTLQGRLILEQQLQPGTTDVTRSGAAPGLYFYTLTTKDGQKKTGKLVLQ